jgi:hypothetical protein
LSGGWVLLSGGWLGGWVDAHLFQITRYREVDTSTTITLT